MKKKEFKVGEVFTAGLVRLKCVEGDTCEGCVFENCLSCSFSDMLVGSCECIDREDDKDVIFIKAD
jgi:hypothetical protein